jgi:hypothetical protein
MTEWAYINDAGLHEWELQSRITTLESKLKRVGSLSDAIW